MSRIPILTLILLGSCLLPAQKTDPGPSTPTPEALKERVSLALGHQAGKRASLKRIEKDDVASEPFTKGFEMALRGEPLPFSGEELREAFSLLQKEITRRESLLAQANEKAQIEFLANNAKNEGVTTLESGLQYLVLETPGKEEELNPKHDKNAPSPLPPILAEVHYVGTLINEKEFDASVGDKPVSLNLDEVIPGFREAALKMPVGARWKIFVPSDLGYGDVRRSDLIGPNELLIFEIELFALKSSEKKEP
jgi:FKBP-type peptidyl-prolyl cis-trans isomerase